MNWIVIERSPPWDGRYEFDLAAAMFTVEEWGWIKRLTGYLPLTIDEAFDGGDPELRTVFAAIALYRAGKVTDSDVPDTFRQLAKLPFDERIRIETDDEPVEAGGGPLPPSSTGNGASSGDATTPSSETSTEILPASGTPASAASASVPAWSGS